MGKHGGEHSFPIGVHQQKTKDCPDSERESERESGRFFATCPVERRVGSSVAGWPVVEKSHSSFCVFSVAGLKMLLDFLSCSLNSVQNPPRSLI